MTDPRLEARKIASRTRFIDHTEEIVFECGHVTLQMVPVPAEWTAMRCAQCINDFVEEARWKGRAD